MNSFKDKMARFMYGRYGMDQLSRNLSLMPGASYRYYVRKE